MAMVITWQAPNGDTVNITPLQQAQLEKAGKWPRNARGEEFCSVSHGLHYGIPTYSNTNIDYMCGKPLKPDREPTRQFADDDGEM